VFLNFQYVWDIPYKKKEKLKFSKKNALMLYVGVLQKYKDFYKNLYNIDGRRQQ